MIALDPYSESFFHPSSEYDKLERRKRVDKLKAEKKARQTFARLKAKRKKK